MILEPEKTIKGIVNVLAITALSLFLYSCTNDIEQLDISQENCESVFTQQIKYKGVLYTSEVRIDKDGNFTYLNRQFEQVMEEIDSNPSAQMLILDDTTLYYYDETDVLENNIYDDIISMNDENVIENSTRATGFENMKDEYLGFGALYDNDNFKGTKIEHGLTDYLFSYNIPNLKHYGLNDKVTSIAVCYNGPDPIICTVLTIWEDSYYNNGDDNRSKHRISIIASKSNPRVTCPDLKKIKKIGSSKSWNDCITSFSLHFGYIDRFLKDY